MLTKVISGGQTGVDRAALDAALECGLAIGGYVPKGRRAEDGAVPERYPLIEMPTSDYGERTRANIAAAGATMILIGSEDDLFRGGTRLTLRLCREAVIAGRHDLAVILLGHPQAIENGVCFLKNIVAQDDPVSVLNIAGRRESKSPGIYDKAYTFLLEVFGVIQEPKAG